MANGMSVLTFVIQHRVVTGVCRNMVVDSFQLFFEDQLTDAIREITLGGADVTGIYKIKYKDAYAYIDIPNQSYNSVMDNNLVIKLAGSYDVEDFCSTPYKGGRACTYRLEASSEPGVSEQDCCVSSHIISKPFTPA